GLSSEAKPTISGVDRIPRAWLLRHSLLLHRTPLRRFGLSYCGTDSDLHRPILHAITPCMAHSSHHRPDYRSDSFPHIPARIHGFSAYQASRDRRLDAIWAISRLRFEHQGALFSVSWDEGS